MMFSLSMAPCGSRVTVLQRQDRRGWDSSHHGTDRKDLDAAAKACCPEFIEVRLAGKGWTWDLLILAPLIMASP
jgi:hypothetical protein